MKKIKLRQLKFGKHNIIFQDGLNYIVGKNASGKTTIFNMIQYILGIKKEFGYSLFKTDELMLKISINEIDHVFQRRVDENKITINSDFERYSFNINSYDYNKFLIEALEPKFDNEVDQNVIKILIKESFDSSSNLPKYSSSDDKLLILGINKRYENKINKYIKDLEDDLRVKKIALEKVKLYKNDVSQLIKRSSEIQISEIENILNQSFQDHESDYRESYDIYKKSQILFEKLQFENEEKTDSIIRELESTFKNLADNLLRYSISLKDALFKKDKFWSEAENTLMNLILKTVIQSKYDITNGIGLLVSDDSILNFDHEAGFNWQNIIRETCKKGQIQYIEFARSTRGLIREDIAYELERGILYE